MWGKLVALWVFIMFLIGINFGASDCQKKFRENKLKDDDLLL